MLLIHATEVSASLHPDVIQTITVLPLTELAVNRNALQILLRDALRSIMVN